MDGVHVAFDGKVVADAELKFTAAGVPLATFSIVAQDTKTEGARYLRVSKFGDEAEDLVRQLSKGTSVYVEGRHTLRGTWTGVDGTVRINETVTAWRIDIQARIGRRAVWRSREGRRDELELAAANSTGKGMKH